MNIFKYVAILLGVLSTSVAFKNVDVNMTLSYFEERGIGSLCLMLCSNDSDAVPFVKEASKISMFVTLVLVNQDLDRDTLLTACWRQHRVPIGIIIPSACPEFEEIFFMASEERMLVITHSWLILHDGLTRAEDPPQLLGNELMVVPQAENIGPRNKILYDQRLISIIDNANTSVDTDVTVAFKVSPSEYQLNAYFNYGKEQGGKFFVEPLGTWSVKNGLNIFSKKYKFYRRFDFNKLGIRFILVARGDSLKSFNIESMNNPNYDPNFLHSSKITTHVLRTLAETHNISYIYTVTDRWIGNYEKNSSRVVSTSLYFREQDISNVIRFKYPGILDRLDFATGTSSNVEAHFFYRIPTKGVGKFENKFLIPFTYASWLCVIGLLALCAVFLSVAARVERRPSAGQYGPFSVLAALCQQFYEDISSEDPMGSSAGRKIGIFVTGTSCVLIYNYYTSSVVSWLLNGPPPLINSLEELNDSPLNVILEDIGYVRSWLYSPGYFFNSKTIKAEDEMRKKKVQTKKAGDPLLEPLDKGIQMVKEGGYAFLMQSSVAGLCFSKILTRMELCELGSLSTIPATPCYSAIQRRSPFKEFYNWGLTRMKERGHANYATRVFYAPVLKCDGTLPRPLALGGAAPAFVLLAFGILISLFILIAEILWARSSGNKENRVIEV